MSGHDGHGGGVQWTCPQAVSINTFLIVKLKIKKVIFNCGNLYFRDSAI